MGGKNHLVYQVEKIRTGRYDQTAASMLIQLKGKIDQRALKQWIGVVAWIGRSPYRKNCKRKNWYIKVSIPQKEIMPTHRDREFEFQTFRSSGPGGQHANKVNSGVRVIHVSSGLITSATERRSQFQNKQLALERMEALLKAEAEYQKAQYAKGIWSDHLQMERGNPIKIFRGLKFKCNGKKV